MDFMVHRFTLGQDFLLILQFYHIIPLILDSSVLLPEVYDRPGQPAHHELGSHLGWRVFTSETVFIWTQNKDINCSVLQTNCVYIIISK
jgi:hypothetical protein